MCRTQDELGFSITRAATARDTLPAVLCERGCARQVGVVQRDARQQQLLTLDVAELLLREREHALSVLARRTQSVQHVFALGEVVDCEAAPIGGQNEQDEVDCQGQNTRPTLTVSLTEVSGGLCPPDSLDFSDGDGAFGITNLGEGEGKQRSEMSHIARHE